jgi:hypothetical protein
MKQSVSELRDGEIFVGNTQVMNGVKVPEHLRDMKTARLGEQAFDIYGKPLDRSYCRPLIIHESEADLYDSIMMSRLKKIQRNL